MTSKTSKTTEKMEYNFEQYGVPVPPLFETYDDETKANIYLYLGTMDEHNKKIYKIAHRQLETSFNLVKSNGFLAWLNSNKT